MMSGEMLPNGFRMERGIPPCGPTEMEMQKMTGLDLHRNLQKNGVGGSCPSKILHRVYEWSKWLASIQS